MKHKAACITAFGGPEVFDVREIDTPEPGPGEVRVRVDPPASTTMSG